MSKDLNKCLFIGRLGQDVDLRYTPTGTACANISLAVGNDYKDKSGKKVEQTEWVKIAAFDKLAEIMHEYLKKGSLIYIEGKMKTRSYEKDGVKCYSTEIIADQMQMLGGKDDAQKQEPRQESKPAQNHKASHQDHAAQNDFEDDIPF